MNNIRKAVQEDIPKIAAIYDRILTEEESGRAAIGWIRGVYPTEQTALDALHAGTLFVLERDGVVAAAAKIDQNQVPEYANAPWRYPDVPPEQVMVLHTLVVDPAFAGQARADGLEELAVMFEKVAAIERSHENRFLTLLAQRGQTPKEEQESSSSQQKKHGYRCQFCGAVFDERPDVCDTCQAIGAFEYIEYYA